MERILNFANQWRGILFLIFSAISLNSVTAQTSVVTQHNDLKRTGWDSTETQLTQSYVSSGRFGELFTRQVDDQIYAQPLVVSNLFIGGGTHNVVFVATVNNSVYAFDADDSATNTPYWQENLTYDSAGYRPPTSADMAALGACHGNYTDFSGKLGIVGTPVIDTLTQTLYVVAKSVVVANGDSTFVQYLHALDITTGAEKPNSPVKITATFARDDGSIIDFLPMTQNQRSALLLRNNVVYICWASYCDMPNFWGWIMGYDATSLVQKYVYNDSPRGGGAGIWMSGQGPAVDDDGNIYVATGNGQVGSPITGDPNDTISRGESLLKLSTASGKLKVTDFFTPANYDFLNSKDLDYGSDGALLIPNTSLSLSGSKEGFLYLINDTAMGGTTTDNSNVRQVLDVNGGGTSFFRNLHGSPVYFKDDKNNEYVYAWASSTADSPGFLKQFPFDRNNMVFDTLNTIVGNTQLPSGGKPGGMLSVSSNGSESGTGILWASHPINGSTYNGLVPGVLQAFDATDITKELWNSNWSAKRDSIGRFAKFVCPTIANGKVYMATFSNVLNVYGLNPPAASTCSGTLLPGWNSADVGYTAYAGDVCYDSVTSKYTITASGSDINNDVDAFHYCFTPTQGINYLDIKMRVDYMQNTDPSAKCGIMFRENLDPGSPNVFLALTPGNGILRQTRTNQNATTVNTAASGSVPYWLRVINDGNLYISYYSSDNINWTSIDTVTIALGTFPYVGLAYTSRNNSILGTAVVDSFTVRIANGGILTRDLIQLTAKNIQNRYAQLSWSWAEPDIVSQFDIERSSATTDFETIGSVPANSSPAGNYSFDDMQPLNNENYYRLKITYLDGSVKYSPTKKVSFNFDALTIYPNPAKDQIFIRNNDHFTQNKNLTILLADVSGRIVAKRVVTTAGVNTISYDLPSGISQGMYILWLINTNGQKRGQKLYISH